MKWLVDCVGNSSTTDVVCKGTAMGANPAKQKEQTIEHSSMTWTEKYRPKVPNDIIGNQSLVYVLIICPELRLLFKFNLNFDL